VKRDMLGAVDSGHRLLCMTFEANDNQGLIMNLRDCIMSFFASPNRLYVLSTEIEVTCP
jgi:hypothetical protein